MKRAIENQNKIVYSILKGLMTNERDSARDGQSKSHIREGAPSKTRFEGVCKNCYFYLQNELQRPQEDCDIHIMYLKIGPIGEKGTWMRPNAPWVGRTRCVYRDFLLSITQFENIMLHD